MSLTCTVNLDLKKNKCKVWSVALYDAETQSLIQADKRKIEAFEMWVWRRMSKVSRADKVSNAEVLQNI